MVFMWFRKRDMVVGVLGCIFTGLKLGFIEKKISANNVFHDFLLSVSTVTKSCTYPGNALNKSSTM